MAIVKFDPFKELYSMRSQMDRIFDTLLRGEESEQLMGKGLWAPAVDIYETENEIVLKAELPGVDKDDLEVKVENNTLILKGEKRQETEIKKENYHRAERIYGQFQRIFTLPDTVDTDKIKASFKSGILTLTLPKKKEAKPKQITVKVEE